MRNRSKLLLLGVAMGGAFFCNQTFSGSNIAMTEDRPFHHLEGGGFRNPPGSPQREATAGEMYRFIRGEVFSPSKWTPPEGHVLSKAEFHRQMAAASNPSVTWLGHSGFIIRLGGHVIITDPFLGERAGALGFGPKRYSAAPISGGELPKADVLLVSHNHYDHLDAPTIEAYPHKQDTQVIVPLGLGAFFTKRGYTKVLEQDWWDMWHSEIGLTITTLPSVHGSGRGLWDQGKTLWASFGITTDEGKIWFSGDTANGDVFNEIGQRAGPFDLALMAIGAYEPRSIMKAVHVTPEEAVEVLRKIGAQSAIGMHWGTIALTPENPFDAPKRFKQAAQAQRFGKENAVVLRVGESHNLDGKTLNPAMASGES